MTDNNAQTATPPGSAAPANPTDILMRFIIACLTPMFLGVSGGDVSMARMAAEGTVAAYAARNQADMIIVAQIIAFGLAALGSLSLSMADDLSIAMALRLRGNAIGLNRAAEQNRRALRESRPAAQPQASAPGMPAPSAAEPGDGAQYSAEPGDAAQYEAMVRVDVAAARRATAEAHHRLNIPRPAPDPAFISPPTRISAPALVSMPAPAPAQVATPAIESPAIQPAPAAQPTAAADPAMTDEHRQALWAAAMSDVAIEFVADLENMNPQDRAAAAVNAAILSSFAQDLLSGKTLPPSPLQR
jgi:hypothetical protein